MDDLCRYAGSALAFIGRYVSGETLAHAVIVAAVLGAVACSVGAQYGIKLLVDAVAAGFTASPVQVWLAFVLLATLIGADNLLWRLASWIASSTFVAVSGDLRRDLFRHLTGHAPSYFVDRMPATLTSRITATSNAVYTLENMFVWNVLPPCMATVAAIIFTATVSIPMALSLTMLAGVLVFVMCRLAAAGRPLHHEFAAKAATVDGEMVDVVANMPLVWAYCGLGREHSRLDAAIDLELGAAAQPVLSGEAAPVPRGGHRTVDHRVPGMGARAVAERRRDRRRRGAGVHARTFNSACHARPGSGTGGRDSACRPTVGGARYPARAASHA